MKNIKISLLLIFLSFSLPVSALSQNTNTEKAESPYKTVNLKFVLEGSPTAEDVGFDNPKSFWQFRYELRFLDEKFNFQYFKEKENEPQSERRKRIRKNNKAYDKAWKKYGVLVFKGKIAKTPLLSAASREIIIPVNLSPEIRDVLAKAGSSRQNPEFRISLNGKISTKTISNFKFKRKVTQSFVCPTKILSKDAQYWLTNICGISVEILKKEEGRIVFGLFSKI